MGPLQIPATFVAGFLALADLASDQFARLEEALADGPLVDPGTLADPVVARSADVEVDQAHEIVASLTSLFGYHRRAHESTGAVAAGVARSPELGPMEPDLREVLAERVERLLATRAISGTAKAVDLQHHRHAVSSVQVVTETRFLFDEDDLEPSDVYGAVLSHTLRIQTFDDDRDTVFTMTDQDLDALRAELDRAVRKRTMIGGRLRESGFDIYDDSAEAAT